MIYTNKYINLISLIITIIIFLILNIFFIKVPKNSKKNIQNIIPKIIPKISFTNDKLNIETKSEISDEELEKWYIEIPKINLKAPIDEGTENDILNKKIGHFTETGLTTGNIGLAGHNRGYEHNYFENLKKLKINDEILYKYQEFKNTYIIDKIEIIENTDWSYLENTTENKITLITCVENEPKYRRCIQATEIKK